MFLAILMKVLLEIENNSGLWIALTNSVVSPVVARSHSAILHICCEPIWNPVNLKIDMCPTWNSKLDMSILRLTIAVHW